MDVDENPSVAHHCTDIETVDESKNNTINSDTNGKLMKKLFIGKLMKFATWNTKFMC